MTLYINRKVSGTYAETVDEVSNITEAERLKSEYQLSDSYGVYYVSTKACSNWES